MGSIIQSPGFQVKPPGRRRQCGGVGGRLGHRSRVGWWKKMAGALSRSRFRGQEPRGAMAKKPRGATPFGSVNLKPPAQSSYIPKVERV